MIFNFSWSSPDKHQEWSSPWPPVLWLNWTLCVSGWRWRRRTSATRSRSLKKCTSMWTVGGTPPSCTVTCRSTNKEEAQDERLRKFSSILWVSAPSFIWPFQSDLQEKRSFLSAVWASTVRCLEVFQPDCRRINGYLLKLVESRSIVSCLCDKSTGEPRFWWVWSTSSRLRGTWDSSSFTTVQ